jgi:hypothetical protein
MKKLTLLIVSLLFAGTIKPQTTENLAKIIFGDNFISKDSAYAAWKEIDPSIEPLSLDTIPYSEATLKKYALKNENNQGQYYLVPTLGLTRTSLEKFWHFNTDTGGPETSATYRLINFAQATQKSWQDYDQQIESMTAVSEDIIPMLDYVEAIATISLTKKSTAVSSQLQFFFINDLVDKNNMIIFSTLITDSINEVVAMEFPKKNFVTGAVNNRYAYYSAGENLEKMVFTPLTVAGLKPGEDVDFFLTVSSAVKP